VRTDKIYLVGFMGAGKTSVARAFGSRLRWRVEDIDERIEAREQTTIADLFAQRGEPHFRQIERTVLRELLPLRHVVIATGGGTFVDPSNRTVINDDGASIWLDIDFDSVIARLPANGLRPLAADRTTLRALYDTRRAAYAFAHLRLDASRAPVEELVERILEWTGY
jgi:shikimate kinase